MRIRASFGRAAQHTVRAWPDFQIASTQAPLFPVNSRSRVGAGRAMQSFGAPLVHMIKLTETSEMTYFWVYPEKER
jgi:hypothetical protein